MKNRMKNKILQVKPESLTLHWLQVTKNKRLFKEPPYVLKDNDQSQSSDGVTGLF